MSKNEVKTNAMRILDRCKVPYTMNIYECDEFVDGVRTADLLKLPYEFLYKTLVTVGNSKHYYVFLIPIKEEIDLKKAAKVVNEKSLHMLQLKELTQVTGYVRGGCTCIGMKKQFPTIIQETAKVLDTMYISGGRVGFQLEINPFDLQKVSNAKFLDVIVSNE